MSKIKSEYEIIIGLILMFIGTICIFYFNYYTDFVLPQKMSHMEIVFFNSQYHFSFERSLCFIFYAFSGALLLNGLHFWDIQKIINRKTIREKIKKGKKEFKYYCNLLEK